MRVVFSLFGIQVDTLAQAYSTKKKSDGWSSDGRRCPSYTDRVLYHSLPDNKSDLLLQHYALCDTVTGSDHRPVSAAFTLFVNRKVGDRLS